MIPATTSQRRGGRSKLLVFGRQIEDRCVAELPRLFDAGDVWVVNRSATLPSSFQARSERGAPLEIRLAAFSGSIERWKAVVFGPGDWRMKTEDRLPPPLLNPGDRLRVGPDLSAEVLTVEFARLITLRWNSIDQPSLISALYRHGRPIQYSHLREELEPWDQQTLFSGPPVSVEPPSASFPLSWELVSELKRLGIRVVSLLHGAGISSTGDAELDRQLPLEEWYDVPAATREAVIRARASGGRVLAVGTSALRALESSMGGALSGTTCLRIGKDTRLKAATDLLSGLHEQGTSHYEILKAFRKDEGISRAHALAQRQGYRSHEYGDLLITRADI